MFFVFHFRSLHLQIEPMQIVPEVDMSSSSDCVVPDNDKAWATGSSNVNFVELSAPRLCLNPFIDAAGSQTTLYFHSSSPRGLHSPSSPASPQIVFFPDNSSQHTLLPSYSSTNPFTSSSSIISQSLPSGTLSNSHSITYDTSRSLPIYLVPTNEFTNSTSSNISLTPECTLPSSSLQIHLHPQYIPRHGHRHSFSEGDSNSNSSLLSPQSHVRPLHGRRSLGSMLGVMRPQRRNSHHNSPSSPSYGMFNDEPPRTRRRSHEPRDNEREILQNLQAAANRSLRPNSAGTNS